MVAEMEVGATPHFRVVVRGVIGWFRAGKYTRCDWRKGGGT